jgi:hypothetical protein
MITQSASPVSILDKFTFSDSQGAGAESLGAAVSFTSHEQSILRNISRNISAFQVTFYGTFQHFKEHFKCQPRQDLYV